MSGFWKPGSAAPGSSVDRLPSADDLATATAITANVHACSDRRQLPIHAHKQRILYALERFQVLIVSAATGSGKTTQLPQYLAEAGWAEDGHVIGCTQPRRVAVTSVASRVAAEMRGELGQTVGYTIRFEDLTSAQTRIKYMTDGVLFREALIDPLLTKYSVIMIDEAHERGTYTDLLLGILKKILIHRPSLRLIISSATIEAETFRDYFNLNPDPINKPADDTSVLLHLEGTRSWPIEVAYLNAATSNYKQQAVQVILGIHRDQPSGDILAFLTGREEIDTVMQDLSDQLPSLKAKDKLLLIPLHAGLNTEEQMAVFEPAPAHTRKVILSTNIAEASVTIEGIRYVVDCGFVKVCILFDSEKYGEDAYILEPRQMKVFNPRTAMDILTTVPCSKASLMQRAGRAGRTAPGKCYRLMPFSLLASLPAVTTPEIARTDLSTVVMQLKSLGINNIFKFDYLTGPPSALLIKALEFLVALGALDHAGRLTQPLGARMAELPVDSMLAKTLLNSEMFACGEEILTIAAMTSVQSVFLIAEGAAGAVGELERRKFTAEEGDHLTLLNVYNAFVGVGKSSARWASAHRLNFKALSRAISIRAQLRRYLTRFKIKIQSCEGDQQRLRRCLASGYFRNAAKMELDGTYRSARDQIVLHVHPSSVMFTRKPQTGWVIYHEVIETNKMFMRDLTVIHEDWLVEMAPHYYTFKTNQRSRPGV